LICSSPGLLASALGLLEVAAQAQDSPSEIFHELELLIHPKLPPLHFTPSVKDLALIQTLDPDAPEAQNACNLSVTADNPQHTKSQFAIDEWGIKDRLKGMSQNHINPSGGSTILKQVPAPNQMLLDLTASIGVTSQEYMPIVAQDTKNTIDAQGQSLDKTRFQSVSNSRMKSQSELETGKSEKVASTVFDESDKESLPEINMESSEEE